MSAPAALSRRERQIMDILYQRGKSSASEVREAMPNAPSYSAVRAMLRVLEDNGWAGQVRFVGFDASDALVKGLGDAHIDGLVLQDPVNMGYLGVMTMMAHIHGQPVERRVDTGVRLVTREQMNDADAKALLHPDLSQWLKP